MTQRQKKRGTRSKKKPRTAPVQPRTLARIAGSLRDRVQEPPKKLVVMVDSFGDQDIYESEADARGNAWGPRFREGYVIATYERTRVQHGG